MGRFSDILCITSRFGNFGSKQIVWDVDRLTSYPLPQVSSKPTFKIFLLESFNTYKLLSWNKHGKMRHRHWLMFDTGPTLDQWSWVHPICQISSKQLFYLPFRVLNTFKLFTSNKKGKPSHIQLKQYKYKKWPNQSNFIMKMWIKQWFRDFWD